MAPLVRTGGSRHTGLAALPHRNIHFEELKRWYDGYLLDTDLHIYNPKSVVDAIRRKRVANY